MAVQEDPELISSHDQNKHAPWGSVFPEWTLWNRSMLREKYREKWNIWKLIVLIQTYIFYNVFVFPWSLTVPCLKTTVEDMLLFSRGAISKLYSATWINICTDASPMVTFMVHEYLEPKRWHSFSHFSSFVWLIKYFCFINLYLYTNKCERWPCLFFSCFSSASNAASLLNFAYNIGSGSLQTALLKLAGQLLDFARRKQPWKIRREEERKKGKKTFLSSLLASRSTFDSSCLLSTFTNSNTASFLVDHMGTSTVIECRHDGFFLPSSRTGWAEHQ